MKKIVLLSTLSAALLASFGAHAADTTELKVKGVIRPAACTPAFTGNSTVDYGTIAASSLKSNEFKQLDVRNITLSVTCDAGTKIAFTVVDNRQSSTLTEIGNLVGASSALSLTHLYGLGMAGSKKIGGYALEAKQITANNAAIDTIWSDNKGQSWGKGWSYLSNQSQGTYHSFAAVGAAIPKADVQNFSMVIGVRPVLNKPEELPLTQNIDLDGSATFEVKYL